MRYALYYTASSDSELTRLGSTWLGRDAFTGDEIGQPVIDGIPASRMADLTVSPRRYGFHATMKAPFRLRSDRSETELIAHFDRFCETTAPVDLPDGLAASHLGHYLALTPVSRSAALNALAGACVRDFDAFRQDLSDEDLRKRQKSGLDERQISYLKEWGYPYIFEDFRFHMTLSISLKDIPETDLLAAACRRYFEPVSVRPMRLDRLAICFEPAPGAPFKIIHSKLLTGQKMENLETLAGQETP